METIYSSSELILKKINKQNERKIFENPELTSKRWDFLIKKIETKKYNTEIINVL